MLQPFDNQFSWSTGISINLNLFDGLSTQANLQRAKIGEKYAEDNLEEVRRQVLLETQTAYLGLEEAKNNIEVAKQRVLAAEEDLKLSTARYELGSGTILEQIDAQVALTSARAGKIQAEYDYRFAQSRLQKAMGRLK
jgi:outer membrane protein TolC